MQPRSQKPARKGLRTTLSPPPTPHCLLRCSPFYPCARVASQCRHCALSRPPRSDSLVPPGPTGLLSKTSRPRKRSCRRFWLAWSTTPRCQTGPSPVVAARQRSYPGFRRPSTSVWRHRWTVAATAHGTSCALNVGRHEPILQCVACNLPQLNEGVPKHVVSPVEVTEG